MYVRRLGADSIDEREFVLHMTCFMLDRGGALIIRPLYCPRALIVRLYPYDGGAKKCTPSVGTFLVVPSQLELPRRPEFRVPSSELEGILELRRKLRYVRSILASSGIGRWRWKAQLEPPL
eukprot:1195057-Prorocentrum_minimum.AAC.4